MANAFFGLGKQKWANGQINWGSDTIHVDLVDLNDVTISLTTFEFRSSIPAGARVATFGPLTGKTSTLGVLDAADFSFSAVSGDQAEALIVWKSTGSDATSPLLIFIDQASSGFPVTPNSGDVAVTWNVAGIATL